MTKKTIIVGVPYEELTALAEYYAEMEELISPDEFLTDVGTAVGEHVSEDGKTIYFEAVVEDNEVNTIVEFSPNAA